VIRFAPALVATLLAGLGGVACASTELSSVWRDESFRGEPFRALLVMGLSEQPGWRAVHEEQMVRHLAAHGVEAVGSLALLPEPDAPTPRRLRGWVRELGVEGVLTTQQVRIRREIDVDRRLPDPWLPWDPWWHGAGEVTVRETETVLLETNLYDGGGRLVWSAVSETFAPASRDAVAREVAERVTGRLAADGLIPAAAPHAGPG
jgi:hypothetical protein